MGLVRESNWTLHCRSNMLPEKIGDYKILDALGSGTFGDVYKVEKDEEVFALKHITLGSKEDCVVLQLEVDSHGSLPKHENIVDLVHYFKSWYRWNIVLEFCELGNLERYILDTQLSTDVITSFMLDMARGLAHLHSNNIVHRDIKPENILLTKGNSDIPVCKISDFGVARFISMASDQSKLSNGESNGEQYFRTFRGTPFFVAPEVRKGKYTESCDIFSMGIVYYLLFSSDISSDRGLVPWIKGGTPFYRATDEQIKSQLDLHVNDARLKQLVGSMLVVDLHGRISASSLAEELQGNETSVPTSEDVDTLATPSEGTEMSTSSSDDDETSVPSSDGVQISAPPLPESTDTLVPTYEGTVSNIPTPKGVEKSVQTSECTELSGPTFKDVVTQFPESLVVEPSVPNRENVNTPLDASDDEVFLAACIVFIIIVMLVWFPFPVFVFCMQLFVVACLEFLPNGMVRRLR